MEETKILQQIQNGDIDQFVLLYDAYASKIYNFIFYKVGNKVDAEDLASETFIKAFDKIKSFDLKKETKFSSWIYTIAHNLVIDFFRENTKKPHYPILEEISQNIDIIKTIDDKQKLKQVLEYLNTLDDDKKNIFIMRIWDNLSYDEISSIIGKTSTNCKTIFSRTLKDVVSKFGVYGLIVLFQIKTLL